MNAIGLLLVWVAVQVSAFCLAGIGLYAVARRRNPATGAWTAGAALAVAVGISALALSPWPRWWSPDAFAAASPAVPDALPRDIAADATPVERLAPELTAGPIPKGATAIAPDSLADEIRHEPRGGWQGALARLRNDVSRTSAAWSRAEWRWPAWVAAVILAGCSLALVRLIVAVGAAHRYRTLARPVFDAPMQRLIEQVRGQIGCARPIELRETAALCSPSTIGWLRPAIILPAGWRSWSAQQRRAVVAHEVAHVARGDFAVWLLAQLGVVLHFYNPLVHFLAGRLRLEQEMAADVWAANLLGSRQLYLTTLAEMALRTGNPPMAWATRPFLPTRGTLMRRVEMLHGRRNLPSLAVSGTRRAALAAMLLVVAGFLAGFRPPGTTNQAEAAPPPSENAAASEPFNLDFVPNDAQFVLALRPAELAKTKSLDALEAGLGQFGLFEPLGLPLEAIAECKFVTGQPASGGPSWMLLMLRSKHPHDWVKLATYFTGKVEKVIGAGQEYYRAVEQKPRRGRPTSYWLPDDRTIVLAPPDMITSTFSLRGPVNGPVWAGRWQAVATGPAAMMIKTNLVQDIFTRLQLPTGEAAGNLTDDADVVLFGCADVAGVLEITGTMECRSPQSAERANKTLSAALTNFRQFTERLGKQRPAPPGATIFQMLSQLVNASKFRVNGTIVQSHTAVNLKIEAGALANQLGQARVEARRNASHNKLKQIGIAMQTYHDAYRHFPPAVLIGPDGKTPYSWRVALLPFLEKPDLYKRYRRDEPWDSQHNRKLIEEAAELFSVPSEGANGDCGYFLITGPGTVFDPANAGTRIRDIIDGTSKTIGIVEAKRSVPWTKPQDIEYDPDKPLPKLGGFFEGGYHAGLMDASVHFLSDQMDAATLRALFSRAGREPVAIP